MKIAIACLTTASIVFIALGLWYRSEIASLNEQLSQATLRKDHLVERALGLDKELRRCKAGYTREVRISINDNSRTSLLKVYGLDREVMITEVNFYVRVPDSVSMLDKLQLLADRLSRFRFGFNPINVMRIEDRADKEIAVVEMAGLEQGGYFNGSTNGQNTTTTLIETFLQRDYAGDWIDGVEFQYEGKPISYEWDHLLIDGTKYRDSVKE